MPLCFICYTKIFKIQDVVFFACGNYICTTCFSSCKDKCFFCRLPKQNHVLTPGITLTLMTRNFLDEKEICEDCNQEINLNQLLTHKYKCYCGAEFCEQEKKSHKQVCSHRQISCPNCTYQHSYLHVCSADKVVCFHCEQMISRCKFSKHIADFHEKCDNVGCDFLGTNIKKHKKNCQYKPQFCSDCWGFFPICKILNSKHIHECDGRSINCSECCQTMKYFQLEKHQQHFCTACKNQGENLMMCETSLEKHIKNCQNRRDLCLLCCKSVIKKNMQEHKKEYCPNRLISCEACSCYVMFYLFDYHVENDCKQYYIKCNQLLCGFHFLRDESNEHKCPAVDVPFLHKPGIFVDYFKNNEWTTVCLSASNEVNKEKKIQFHKTENFFENSQITLIQFSYLSIHLKNIQLKNIFPFMSILRHGLYLGRSLNIDFENQGCFYETAIVTELLGSSFKYGEVGGKVKYQDKLYAFSLASPKQMFQCFDVFCRKDFEQIKFVIWQMKTCQIVSVTHTYIVLVSLFERILYTLNWKQFQKINFINCIFLSQ